TGQRTGRDDRYLQAPAPDRPGPHHRRPRLPRLLARELNLMPDPMRDNGPHNHLTRLVTFDAGQGPRHGVLLPHTATPELLDLGGAPAALERLEGRPGTAEQVLARYGGDMLGLIERADVALPAVREVVRRAAAGGLPQQAGQAGQTSWRHLLRDVLLLAPVPR